MGEIEKSAVAPGKIKTSLQKKITPNNRPFQRLLTFWGFPEPFLKQDRKFLNVWLRSRTERLIREDLLDLTRTRELFLIETMVSLLPEKVGAPFSLTSLVEDIEVTFPTVRRWLEWISQLFYIYRIPPYSKRLTRSIKKQPKLYLWEWREVMTLSLRYENMVASHLLKACHYWTDRGLGTFDLYYVRDKEKREVDFLIMRDKKPWLLAEVKQKTRPVSPHLYYYAKILKPDIVLQLCSETGIHEKITIEKGVTGFLISADSFLKLLP